MKKIDNDKLYEKILLDLKEIEFCSISYIQRKHNVGFVVASSLFSRLVEDGYVSSNKTSKGSKVFNDFAYISSKNEVKNYKYNITKNSVSFHLLNKIGNDDNEILLKDSIKNIIDNICIFDGYKVSLNHDFTYSTYLLSNIDNDLLSNIDRKHYKDLKVIVLERNDVSGIKEFHYTFKSFDSGCFKNEEFNQELITSNLIEFNDRGNLECNLFESLNRKVKRIELEENKKYKLKINIVTKRELGPQFIKYVINAIYSSIDQNYKENLLNQKHNSLWYVEINKINNSNDFKDCKISFTFGY